jgi:hypothetical protein
MALKTFYVEDYIYIHRRFVYHFPFDSFCQVKIEVVYCFYKTKIIININDMQHDMITILCGFKTNT